MSGYLDAYLRQRDEYSTQGFMTGARPRSGSADASIARLRSGFGAQVSSTKPSSPGIGFGTAGRDASLKVCGERGHRTGGAPGCAVCACAQLLLRQPDVRAPMRWGWTQPRRPP